MTLYLVQHGQSVKKVKDPNQSLSTEGRATVIHVAHIASNASITVTTIYHSGKLRTLQTAELFSEYLKTDKIEQITGLSPLDSVENFAKHFQFTDK